MERNILSSLKEKKKVMKLSMAALVGAITVCGGAALCSVSAMVSDEPGDSASTMTVDKLSNGTTAYKRPREDNSNSGIKKIHLEDGVETLGEEIRRVIDQEKEGDVILENLCGLLEDKDKSDIEQLQKEWADDDKYYVDYISQARVQLFCEKYGGCCDVEEGIIDLLDCELEYEAVSELADILKLDSIFFSLNLACCNIEDEGAMYISDILKRNTTLSKLNLAGNAIGAEGASEISEALKTNTTLTELILAYIYIESDSNSVYHVSFNPGPFDGIQLEGAKAISELLRVNTTLTKLDLSGNLVGAEGARLISEALKTNTVLTDFIWKGDYRGRSSTGFFITEEMHFVFDALKENTTLVYLDVSGNFDLDDMAELSLVEALRVNTTLNHLILTETLLSHKGIENLYRVLQMNTVLVDLGDIYSLSCIAKSEYKLANILCFLLQCYSGDKVVNAIEDAIKDWGSHSEEDLAKCEDLAKLITSFMFDFRLQVNKTPIDLGAFAFSIKTQNELIDKLCATFKCSRDLWIRVVEAIKYAIMDGRPCKEVKVNFNVIVKSMTEFMMDCRFLN